jgi:hypothetical protein
MRRLSSLDRVRAVTAAVAGGTIALAVLGLLLADSILALGYLPGAVPLLILATALVAAWRAEEAVATRSPLRWAWGSSWRSLLASALGSGLILGVIFGRAAVDVWPPASTMEDAADLGPYVALIVTLFYAPVPLLLGTAAHLCAALTVRRAVRRWWSWFATTR